jgi:hypothetical protein
MLDEDASEPSSPGSMYEMSPPVPPVMQREFTSLEALEMQPDNEDNATVTGSNRQARHLSSTLAPYCIADPRTSAMTEHASDTGYDELRTQGPDDSTDNDGEDAPNWGTAQHEWGAVGPHPGGAPARHAEWACETQDGATWHNRGPVCNMHDPVPRH